MNARIIDRGKCYSQLIFCSHSVWQRINGPLYHPVAKHFKRQLQGGRGGPPVIALALLAAAFLFFAAAHVNSSVGASLVWSLPLCLSLHSLMCSPQWIYRIVTLIARQGRDGVMDEVSMIPPGPVFIYMAICKVVLHEGDALACTTMLRKLAAAIVFVAFSMTLLVTLIALETVDSSRLALMLIELSLMAFLIVHEHKQSVVLMCLLPMSLSRRLKGAIDGTFLALASYAALQVMSFMLALAAPVTLQAIARHFQLAIDIAALGLALTLSLFLLIRECFIYCLWRTALYQSNADYGDSTGAGASIGLKALGGRAY